MHTVSTAKKKKQIERRYFDCFRDAIPDFPEGRIEVTEEPDFIVHTSVTTIGIELTEMHVETPQGAKSKRAIEAMRDRVVAKAQELYLALNLPPVEVSIFINGSCLIKKNQVQVLSEAICNIVVNNFPERNSLKEETIDWENRSYFPELIHHVSVRRFDFIKETFFSSGGATWVPTLADTDVQRAVAPKEPKYKTYKLQCREAWLVILVDIGPISTWFRFDASALGQPLRTQFDRVFVLRPFGSKLIEFQLAR